MSREEEMIWPVQYGFLEGWFLVVFSYARIPLDDYLSHHLIQEYIREYVEEVRRGPIIQAFKKQ